MRCVICGEIIPDGQDYCEDCARVSRTYGELMAIDDYDDDIFEVEVLE